MLTRTNWIIARPALESILNDSGRYDSWSTEAGVLVAHHRPAYMLIPGCTNAHVTARACVVSLTSPPDHEVPWPNCDVCITVSLFCPVSVLNICFF
ncbi:hypothetical protein AVEN_155487-1 [Araneus ventricosus]|uniref:Uncharacterized protein n=1 Tax=Araneus ventricosus TaxID=182803 RepID=A0A4Y2SI96_ARAVE|nr:hypothetical protein AVEN_155487-1 [Araneus ventricosus]